MEFVYDGIQRGAAGVNLGRNVWKHDYPVAMMRSLRAVIHNKKTPKEALEIFQELKNAADQKKTGASK
jgi:putative autoinducer-2 (AI-2) aldolase